MTDGVNSVVNTRETWADEGFEGVFEYARPLNARPPRKEVS